MNLTDQDVKEILRLLEASPYTELKLTTDNISLELKAGQNRSSSDGGQASAAADNAQGVEAAADAPQSTAAPGEIVEIPAPLPGTFYRAPSPGAPPFTEIGQIVEEDATLALVETMKLMTSIVAGCKGEVIEIGAENGALVEVGDVLVRIRVTGDG